MLLTVRLKLRVQYVELQARIKRDAGFFFALGATSSSHPITYCPKRLCETLANDVIAWALSTC